MSDIHRDIVDEVIRQMEWAVKSRTVWTADFLEDVVVSLKWLRESEQQNRARVSELEDIIAGKKPLIDGGES